jgi:arylesterase/paraoxonase
MVVIVLAAGFLLLRGFRAAGYFTSITPDFSGRCTAIGGIAGVEDMQIDARDGLVFIAVRDHGAPGKTAAQDGIYTMNLNGAPCLTRLSGTPAGFHPGGLSLLRLDDSTLILMVINHRDNTRPSIDIFNVKPNSDTATLTARATIEGGLLAHPNDIAAVGPNAFYITNDSTVTNPTLRTLENYALLRRANVLYFNGDTFRVVARGLDFANGIQVSPNGARVYVSTTLGRALYTYTREAFTGDLTEVNKLTIAPGLDNIDIDAQGNLWVADHPRLVDPDKYGAETARTSASQIFKVTLENGLPQAARPVYVDNGAQIGAAATAVLVGKRLLIGSPLEDKILDCTLK